MTTSARLKWATAALVLGLTWATAIDGFAAPEGLSGMASQGANAAELDGGAGVPPAFGQPGHLYHNSGDRSIDSPTPATNDQLSTAKTLLDYYGQMSLPKPLVVRQGAAWKMHRAQLRQKLLESIGLWPLPERIALDVHQSAPLDHPWCTVRRVAYQLWPGVYTEGLLFLPKALPEQPAPAMLCPHGHWQDGNADPEVQKRCLTFARLGYVTFSPVQNHYEDLWIGISHQTLMVWGNMRAVDFLQSLPQVDQSRIGVAGESGGGLQTEMLVALDDRVRAATIVGLTCDFREIMFPDHCHCTCNHFPGVMQFTDHPEISTLGMPAALQFLTMNDWTKNFHRDNLPSIRELYAANGFADRVDCQYYDTPHTYDRPKRERTYAWMERWVRGRNASQPISEPSAIQTFPVPALKNLSVEVPANKGFGQLSRIYANDRGHRVPRLEKIEQWQQYRDKTEASLRRLLGMHLALPRSQNEPKTISSRQEGQLVIEQAAYPSEGNIRVPTIVLRRQDAQGRLPVAIILAGTGKEPLLASQAPANPRQLAHDGALVVLPDLRCFGEMFSTGGKDPKLQRQAWERNGIVWGRPVSGMACTDLQGVLDGLTARADADLTRVKLISRESGELGVTALLAAALDPRVASADLDVAGGCFAKRNVLLVSGVLQHGDVLQWAALMANRELRLRNVPPEAGDPQWLQRAFTLTQNPNGLRLDP